MTSPSDEILIQLLAEASDPPDTGESTAAFLDLHAQSAAILAPLLATISALREIKTVPPRSAQVAARSRAQYMAAVRELAQSRQNLDPLARLALWWQGVLAGVFIPQRVPAGLVAILLLVMMIGLTGTGVITASATALPGDSLYGVKTTVEQAQMLLARDEQARTWLIERAAERRRQEAQTILELRRPVALLSISGVLDAFDAATWSVSGLIVKVTAETILSGRPQVGATVSGSVAAPGDGTLIARELKILAAPPVESTPTPLPTPTATASPAPTATSAPSATPTDVPTPTQSPQPERSVRVPEREQDDVLPRFLPTHTRTPTATLRPRPSATPTLATPPTPERQVVKARLEGYVTLVEPGRWKIDDTIVIVDANTVLINNPQLGDKVEVWAQVRTDGSLLALQITSIGKPDARPEPFECTGILEQTAPGAWRVCSRNMRIREDTVIEGTPKIGDWLEVKAERHAGGETWINRVTVLTLPEYNIDGPIQAIADRQWRIRDEIVWLDERTQRVGVPPQVGYTAEIVAVRWPDGRVVARIINVIPPKPTRTRVPTATATVRASALSTATPTPTHTKAPPSPTPVTPTSSPPPTASPTRTATLAPPPAATEAPTATIVPAASPGAPPAETRAAGAQLK